MTEILSLDIPVFSAIFFVISCAVCRRIRPVSYTHLDVYKRQVLHIQKLSTIDGGLHKHIVFPASFSSIDDLVPVSYTHLDVYKRQGYIVAKLDVLSTLRADMGAEGYFTAQQEKARAIAAAFAQTEETH